MAGVHTWPTLKCDLYIHRIVYIVYKYHTIVYKQIHIQLYKYHVSLLRPHLSPLSIVTRLLPVTGCYIHSFLSRKMTMMIMMMILHSLIPIQEDDDDGHGDIQSKSKSAPELKVKSPPSTRSHIHQHWAPLIALICDDKPPRWQFRSIQTGP